MEPFFAPPVAAGVPGTPIAVAPGVAAQSQEAAAKSNAGYGPAAAKGSAASTLERAVDAPYGKEGNT
eukprot:7123783-Karenia_brevis.AAC.1